MINKPEIQPAKKIKNRIAAVIETPLIAREEFIRYAIKFIMPVDEAGLASMYSFVHRTLDEDIFELNCLTNQL